MQGIPQALTDSLQQALMDCDEFHNYRQLRTVFSSPRLIPWRDRLPMADNLRGQVSGIIGYLADKEHTRAGNVLVILLRVLAEQYYPNPDDELHGRLLALADQLALLKKSTPKPEKSFLEANPKKAQMLWTIDIEKMLHCARSVARVEVLRFRKGKEHGRSTGTGWLVTPNLLLTCWHVIEALSPMEHTIGPDDLQKQLDNTLITFDYTVAGKGLQYEIAALEHPTHTSHPLDYALLRLSDQIANPLSKRGYLNLIPEAPITKQTSLYIIQHPLGQPQQSIGGMYVAPSPKPERILYTTPTEPGTSGSPVLNRSNWGVVAVHNGENKPQKAREGTLIKAILADLKTNRLDLYEEIMDAQTALNYSINNFAQPR